MNHMNRVSRRRFLGAATGLAASGVMPASVAPMAAQLAVLASLSSSPAHAADTSGYKAVICLYLNGGSDHHNWVVPIDPQGYAEYTASRRELAWPLDRLQPISVSEQASGRSFGMPVELAPLRKWYEAGQGAIVANVGPLVRPITKADYLAGLGLPPKLYSHNDQAANWQSLGPEGARSGWGGRMGDILMSANAQPTLTAISATGNAVFLTGTSLSQYQVSMEGPVAAAAFNATTSFGSKSMAAALQRSYARSGDSAVQAEYNRVMQRGASTYSVLQTALATGNVPAIPTIALPTVQGGDITSLDKLALAKQLRMVMRLIAAHQLLGMKRQVFMVSMGGFDAHANQMRDQPIQMAQVAASIDYVMTSLTAMGLQNNVTLFTASDFGRTLLSNGDGSDHGWGNHHFVMGGAVRGRRMVGAFPNLAVGSTTDIGSGRLLPTMGVSQLAASLGTWMGLSASELSIVLPNLSNLNAPPMLF